MSKVYFLPINEKTPTKEIISGLQKLLSIDEINSTFSSGQFTALKMHFGEGDNPKTVSPTFVKAIVDAVKEQDGKPFVTDSNTLYRGNRGNSVDHIHTAFRHGYSIENLGAPVIIFDGLSGKNFAEIPINLKHCETAKIAKDILSTDNLIGLAHITGHGATGFAGNIKNIGMGLASRGGKQVQHSGILPTVNEENCIACGECAKWCPVDAITVDEYAVIDEEICIGCGECTATCQFNAISIRWDESSENLQEKMAEHAYASVKSIKGKSCFFNFLLDVTRDCDCGRREQESYIDSLGIVASTDIVAADQAAFDLMAEHEGADLIDKWHGKDGLVQVKYGEEIGLGSRDYELIEV